MGKFREFFKQNQVIVALYRLFYRCVSTIYWNSVFVVDKVFRREVKYANCFVFTTPIGILKKNNWGDDLNFFLFNEIANEKIRFVPFEKLLFSPNVIRYSLIGSIIGDFCLDNTVVYGSGCISSKPIIDGLPKKVCSVRGPLTRKVLQTKGISCPEVYGDPALLTPYLYRPASRNRESIGIIPHYRTTKSSWKDSKWVKKIKEKNNIQIIDMSNYKKWTDIIDQICSCKCVLSESLHGLIIAEAYSIPSVWVELNEHNMPWEWEFKFNDFYLSISKKGIECLKLYQIEDSDVILDRISKWKPGHIDYDGMIKTFPFKLKDEIVDER